MVTFLRIIFFLCLWTGGFCCNSGWYPYFGKCYKASQNLYTYRMAKHFCQLSGGQLAFVTEIHTLRFMNAIQNFNGAHEYWIQDGNLTLPTTTSSTPPAVSTDFDDVDLHDYNNHSSAPLTVHSSLCPYAKVLKIDLEYCSEKKFFVCESLYPDDPDACPTGFDYYGTHCYKAVSSVKANYDDAVKFCMMQNSRLAVLETEEKEWEAKSVLLGKNETYLVAAKRKDDAIKWDNDIIFNTIHDFFGNYSEGDCVGFLSDPEHPLVFVWTHVKCEDQNNFLCEINPQPNKTETTTIEITTLGPLECPHGYNWKSHNEYCFWETSYETERLNWFQARDFCKLYGGDLASYDNAEEERIGLGGAHGHFRGLWIGLKREENSVFHWVDGNDLTYTNWAINEPNLNSSSKFCVTHSSTASRWALDYCGVRRWFVCRAPKGRNQVLPDIPTLQNKIQCKIQSTSIYRTQWYEFQGHCYLILDAAKYTWDTARHFCQDNDAHMASIHSFEETDFIIGATTSYADSDFWIGLHTHGLRSSFEWTDNSALDFIYWADNRTEPKQFNTCIDFNKRDGSWDVDNCNRLQGVICKRGINATYDFTSTEPTTVMPGNCENGWYSLGNKCYKFWGNLWSQRVSWQQANAKCEAIDASLASIHNQDEQEFLSDIVLEANTDLWIGLRMKEDGAIFHWSDESRVDYTNWNVNEPQFSSDRHALMFRTPSSSVACVKMEYGKNIIGKWNDIRCEEKKGFICQKYKDPRNVEPYEDPFSCPNMTDWSRLGKACYGVFQQMNSTWLEAQGECKKRGANLVTFKSMAVSIFLKRKLKPKQAYYWIGIRETMEGQYTDVRGHPLFYSYWMVGQPQAASQVLDNCAAITSDGEWLVKSCKEKHPFICKLSIDSDPEPKIDKTHTCRNLSGDWNDIGGNFCYMYEAGVRLTWINAMHFCFRHGGYLASLHSMEEINRVRRIALYYNKLSSIHIGLGKKKDGSYAWVDNSPVDFTNWESGETRGYKRECVELDLTSGKWNTIDCDESDRGFVCSSPKIPLYFDDPLPLNETSQKEIISYKLTAGGIIGIVICFMVILTIIGVTAYYLKPTNIMQPKLQPRLLLTENL